LAGPRREFIEIKERGLIAQFGVRQQQRVSIGIAWRDIEESGYQSQRRIHRLQACRKQIFERHIVLGLLRISPVGNEYLIAQSKRRILASSALWIAQVTYNALNSNSSIDAIGFR
jgi:hypothetical protein